MILSYFNSYFEIFFGLNLGYAAFKYFRNELKKRIFKIGVSPPLDNLKSRLNAQVSEKGDNPEFSNTLTRIQSIVEIQGKSLDNMEDRGRRFFIILKSISFILSLLCITYLIVAGFQDQAIAENKFLYSEYMFYLTCFTAVFSFAIFYSSISFRMIKNRLKISFYQVIVAFFVFSFVSCNKIFDFLAFDYSKKMILILVIPLILFFLFTTYNVLRVDKYSNKKFNALMRDFFKFLIKNLKTIGIFIVIICAGLVPILFFCIDTSLDVIKYCVILLTPAFLFLFLTIRVFIHMRHYGKKYNNLSREQMGHLDFLLNAMEGDNEGGHN